MVFVSLLNSKFLDYAFKANLKSFISKLQYSKYYKKIYENNKEDYNILLDMIFL